MLVKSKLIRQRRNESLHCVDVLLGDRVWTGVKHTWQDFDFLLSASS